MSILADILTALQTMAAGTSGTFQGDLTLENGEVIKNDTDGQIDLVAALGVLAGSTGGLILKASEVTADITASASVSIPVAIPSGCFLIGCQLRVDAALAETWDAEWNDGSSLQAIASNAAVALNTKVPKFHDPNANTPLTDATTNIVVAPNGGGSFTAQGTIRAIAYYFALAIMADYA